MANAPEPTLDDITTVYTSRKERRRVGRGIGSGLGKTGGRGSKGEGSRTGGKNRGPLFEGGQFPFWMRLPKRGFTNFEHRVGYQPVNLAIAVKRITGDITNESLVEAGLSNGKTPVKLVSGAEVKLAKGIKVSVNRVTASVRSAIEAAGGTLVELDRQVAADG
jgi:large subunit ribosomal protein L15